MQVTITFCLRLGTLRRRFESAQASPGTSGRWGHKVEMTRHFRRVATIVGRLDYLFIPGLHGCLRLRLH